MRAGDASALDRMLELWLPRVQGYARRRLGDAGPAREVASRVFTHLVEDRAGPPQELADAAWLLALTRVAIADVQAGAPARAPSRPARTASAARTASRG